LPIAGDIDGPTAELFYDGRLHSCPVRVDGGIDELGLKVVDTGSRADGNFELLEELENLWKKYSLLRISIWI
jgi:hypothetical protein